MADYDYDVIIVGCGVGGHGAALHARGQVCCSVRCSVVQCFAACVAVPRSRPPCSWTGVLQRVLQRVAVCVAEPPSMRADWCVAEFDVVRCNATEPPCLRTDRCVAVYVAVRCSASQCVLQCRPPCARRGVLQGVAVCFEMRWSRPPCARIGVLQRVLQFVFQCVVALGPLILAACAWAGSENCHFHGR